MCGIIGWTGFSGTNPALRLDLLRHRGPDDQGQEVYRSQSQRATAVLGSTRLAIIDLSPAGHMPMEYPGEPLAIVFNGEIYNFQELRAELESQGERFFSRTDTEVILRGYRLWGDGVVERLQGMFAFALWDGRGEGRLLLARDRFGKKPLYYREEAGKGIWFASELKALLVDGGPREIDPGSLEYYLDRGYPPSDRGMLRGYRKVLPGHLLVWERGELRDRPYWDLPDANPSLRAISNEEAKGEMRARLTEAVSKRLVADVPIGLLLSGGVDSSSVLTLMSKFFPNPVASYTACFGTVNLDEGEKARQTALLMGCRHHAIMISPRSGRLLPFIASQMDEPVADPSAIATYLICRRAREDVTVLLTGDGSDELLLGYPRYRLHAAAQVMSRIFPVGLRRPLSRLLPPWSLLGRTLSAPEDPLLRDRYWLDHGRPGRAAFSRSAQRLSREEVVRQVLREDVQTWLVEDILMKVDKMSMATAVEIRVPFLDQNLADWIASLPVSARMSWRRGKKILYAAMGGLVPKHISWSKKQPFHLPIDDWFQSEWRILAQDILLDKTTIQRGWVDEGQVRNLLKEHLARKANHGRRLYQLLILELWARSILDRGESEPGPINIDDCARELATERPVRRVAVIAPAGIGDTMRLTPALRQLGGSDANVSVTLYVASGRGSDEVMAGAAPVDRHVMIDFQEESIAKIYRLIADLRKNPPEQLISTWFSKISGLVHFFCGVKQQSGWVPPWSLAMKINKIFYSGTALYDPSQKDDGIYDALAFGKILGIDVLQNLAPFIAPPIWEEKALAPAKQKVMSLPRPILAVNGVAQASIRQREYPLKLMAQALTELLTHKIIRTIVLLGDAYAQESYEPLPSSLGPGVLDLSGELSLSATSEVMRLCDGVLSIDGGLLHVALATNLPVVALYGPTEPYTSDPREEPGRYVKLSAYDDCRCIWENHRGIRVIPGCREQAICMSSISPSRIVESVSTLMASSASLMKERQDVVAKALEVPIP
jgi:asparagine synthase (glutamine-hydrolysing)